jgi:hypothetical protein
METEAQSTPSPDTGSPAMAALGGTQADAFAQGAAVNDAQQLPAVSNRTPPPSPDQAQPPEHKTFLSDLLHAVGDVFGGPKTAQRVNPQTGAIENVTLSRGQRISHGIGTALIGAAAGAAQHGPGAVGKAALAGVQAEQEQQGIQKQNVLAEAGNVRATNAAELEKQQVQANLAKMSQEQARTALDMKVKGIELDEHQTALANSMQDILNIPGAKLLKHFNSNDEINSHLETVGPQLSKQYAIDLAQNNIRLIQNPKGGFDAVEIPKQAGEKPIGEGKTLLTPVIDPKTNKLTLKQDKADPSMTWDKFQQWNGNSFNAYNVAQEQTSKITEQQAAAKKDVAEASEAYSKGRLALAQAKNLEGGNAKTEDGKWNPASIPVALVEGNMDPTQLSKRTTDYNAKIQQANEYSLAKYGKPFDLAQAQSDYKYATTSANQNTLKMIQGMVEPGGAIDIAKGAAVALPKLNSATLNKVFNATATEFGGKQETDFHTAMLGLADEYSKVMGGGVSSDTGRQQALDILKASYSKGQMDGAIAIMQKDISARKSALVGGNRYLIKQYGAPPPPPPQGASAEVVAADGKTVIGHVVNGQYVPASK